MAIGKSLWLLSALLGYASVVVGQISNEIPDYKDWDTETILKWDPPASMKKGYHYYLSGFDQDNSPIWIAEMGRWDTRGALENGTESEINYKKYVIQFLKRCDESVKLRNTDDNPVTEFVFIVDMEGYSAAQSTPKVLTHAIWMARQFTQAFNDKAKLAYIINSNFVFTSIWNLVRPIVGAGAEKLEIFGSNRERWIPELLKALPKDQLPSWYGGSKNHKPVEVYG